MMKRRIPWFLPAMTTSYHLAVLKGNIGFTSAWVPMQIRHHPSVTPLVMKGKIFHSLTTCMTRSSNAEGFIDRGDIFSTNPSLDARVIQAVEELKGSPVMESDIASIAGVSLSTARKSLSTLAVLTRGTVAVTSDGALVYTFPNKGGGSNTIASILASKSQTYRLLQIWNQKIQPTLFRSIRITFGLILYLQIFLVFASIFFASVSISSTSSNNNSNNDDDRHRGTSHFHTHLNLGLWDLHMLMDLLLNTASTTDSSSRNILSSIFSYVFGDGNPNQGIEDERLKVATQLIRKNGGVVIAEQLIPLLEDTPTSSSSSSSLLSNQDDEFTSSSSLYVDENFVLPIVSKLGGEPIVSEEGDILYWFPDLLLSTEASILVDAGLSPNATNLQLKKALTQRNVDTKSIFERVDLIHLLQQSIYSSSSSSPILSTSESMDYKSSSLDTLLLSSSLEQKKKINYNNIVEPNDNTWPIPIQKQMIPFNQNDSQSNIIAGFLGVLNLFGTIKLQQMLFMNPILMVSRLPIWYTLVQSALPLLLTYAIGFNLIPTIRQWSNYIRNKKIQDQNEQRLRWYKRLLQQQQQGKNMLKRKLAAAESIRSRVRQFTKDQIIYDTNVDFTILKQKKELSSLDDFDNRVLKADDSSHVDS